MNRKIRILVTSASFALVAGSGWIQPAAASGGGHCYACVSGCNQLPWVQREDACDEHCSGLDPYGYECHEDEWEYCDIYPELDAVIPFGDLS